MTHKDGSFLHEDMEKLLKDAFVRAARVPTSYPPEHSTDEALAVHWIAFLTELNQITGIVTLQPDHYREIAAAGKALPEQLQPSQLVARIIDEWLGRHPNAATGSIRD
jgi:hypothetical protein